MEKKELLQLQTNAENVNNSNYSKEENEELIVQHAPFHIVKVENEKWLITMGNQIVDSKEYRTKEDAIEEIDKVNWELILNSTYVFSKNVQKIEQEKNTVKTKNK